MSRNDVSAAVGLLRLLADGKARSGPELASALGISRAGVWKRAESLGELGVGVSRSKLRGYQLERPIELLDSDVIEAQLPPAVRNSLRETIVLESVASTNDLALSSLHDGSLIAPTVLFAEHQTRGRGRRGREWFSPFGSNLYMSLVWRFDAGISALEGLSLVIGLAVARVLKRDHRVPVQLKWPNDILADSAKLGGILIDVEGDLAGPVHAVIGIGLNVGMPRGSGAEITQAWTDLGAQCGTTVSRNSLAAQIVDGCISMLGEFSEKPFSEFREEWNDLDALRGREVCVNLGNTKLHGTALGANDSGAMLLRAGNTVHEIAAGEVTVRAEH